MFVEVICLLTNDCGGQLFGGLGCGVELLDTQCQEWSTVRQPMAVEIESFYGVYLLLNMNPKYKGRTYIGYTVNPNRRIKQHNTGTQAGGARQTSGKGPWEMVLIIHGFPNDITSLRFEWAWQHPKNSRCLKHLTAKKKSESQFQYRFRIVSEMLRLGPWTRLPLTIRWLKQQHKLEFSPDLLPPVHMPLVYGPVKCKKVNAKTNKTSTSNEKDSDYEATNIHEHLEELSPCNSTKRCSVCFDRLKPADDTVTCFHPRCRMVSHPICLSQKFLASKDEIIPIDGKCPKCNRVILWGDLIRHKKGCYQHLSQVQTRTCSYFRRVNVRLPGENLPSGQFWRTDLTFSWTGEFETYVYPVSFENITRDEVECNIGIANRLNVHIKREATQICQAMMNRIIGLTNFTPREKDILAYAECHNVII